MDLNKTISTLFHTIRYLKPIQVYARILLYIKKLVPNRINWNQNKELNTQPLILSKSIPLPHSIDGQSFKFLNLKKDFPDTIDWNYLGYGRLWTYNLNYFEYLGQKDMTPKIGTYLVNSYINQLSTCRVGMEPYPLSIRCFNWIQFFIRHNISNSKFDSALFKQLNLLTHKIEYHLLGNHILENGFALLFGAYYFNNIKFYSKAKKILISELSEQILTDGAHFELSPMYHCIMLHRVMDCYNLVANNELFDKELFGFFKDKGELMLGWINAISFSNGNIPLLNDAAFGIAPSLKELNDYACRIGLNNKKRTVLNESGYKKFSSDKFELVADVGAIGPDYQPGHSHADTFNFELYINGRPVIVDTGTSTYEVNKIRFYERSTSAHNTVVIGNRNSSEVWAGHRVAKRAQVQILKDSETMVSASHNGYKSLCVNHIRSFEMVDNEFKITDEICSQGIAYLHFFPSEKIDIVDKSIVGSDFKIDFLGVTNIDCINTDYSPEFNSRLKRTSVRIKFNNKLVTIIK